MKRWARIAYVSLVLLAAPAMLWTSFEVYGLTLAAPQMPFYSIVHTGPVIALMVLLCSLPLFLLWAVVNGVLLGAAPMRKAVGITPRDLKIYLRFQVAHVTALVFYETWSGVDALRVLLCLVGIWLLCTVLATAVGFKPKTAP